MGCNRGGGAAPLATAVATAHGAGMGAMQDLSVAFRRWRQVRGANPLEEGGAEREALRGWAVALSRLLAEQGQGTVEVFELDATTLPWLDTRLDLGEGEDVSVFAAGRVVLSAALDIWIGPSFQLWLRVGEQGEAFRGTRESHSFRADRPGRLYLAGVFPGQWGDRAGRVSTPLAEYASAAGGLTVAVLRWTRGPEAGHRDSAGTSIAAAGRASFGDRLAPAIASDPRIRKEIARLGEAAAVPEGWRHLWFLGPSEIFRAGQVDGHACLSCATSRDAGILQREVALDLEPGTRLRWDWNVEALPSRLPEDTMLSHDYLSIAVEFENGRDITYTWSRELPVGHGFWCPLPTWKDREFHVVVRRGEEGLGAWQREERDLHADYARYMGTPPSRVVRVWLIAVSLFQRLEGRALYRSIVLEGPKGTTRVL